MFFKIQNLQGTTKDPIRKRRSELIKRPVSIGGRILPPGKITVMSVDQFNSCRDTLMQYYNAGVISIKGNTRQSVEELLANDQAVAILEEEVTLTSDEFLCPAISQTSEHSSDRVELAKIIVNFDVESPVLDAEIVTRLDSYDALGSVTEDSTRKRGRRKKREEPVNAE